MVDTIFWWVFTLVSVFGFFLAYGMVEKDLSSPANDHMLVCDPY